MIATPEAPTPFDSKNWGTLVTEDQVRRHRIVPQATRSHQPIPHCDPVEYVQDTLSRMGFVLSEPTIYLTNDDFRSNMFAGWGIAHKDLPATRGFQWEAYLINSHNKKHSLQLGGGHRTFVCSNGMVHSPLGVYRSKHTTHVNAIDKRTGLPRWKSRLLAMAQRLVTECRRLHQTIESFKDVGLDATSAIHHERVRSLTLDAADKGLINAAGALSVYRHWKNPEHEEFKDDQTVWRLMQAFTSQARGKSAFDQKDTMTKVFDMFADEFGTTRLSTLTDPVAVPGGDF